MDVWRINRNTGETHTEYGLFTSYEQLKKEKQEKEERRKRQLERQAIKEEYRSFGNFNWILARALRQENIHISTANIARLMYLSTYLTYDNLLCSDNNKALKKDDLQKILRLSKAQFYEFYNECIEKGSLISKDGKFHLDGNFTYKGKFIAKLEDGRTVRLYHSGIRDLYRNCKVSSHKFLGYIFQLLPYINQKYNCVCQEIFETDMKNIKCLTIGEICDLLSYSRSNSARLKEIFLKCEFTDKSKAVGMVVNSGGVENWRLFINPRLYFAGNAEDYKRVEILGKFLEK